MLFDYTLEKKMGAMFQRQKYKNKLEFFSIDCRLQTISLKLVTQNGLIFPIRFLCLSTSFLI